MTALFLFLQLHGADIVQAITAIISGASIIANFTPTDKDNKALGAISNVVHFLAANFFALNLTTPTYNK